jgi:hypothetical protein
MKKPEFVYPGSDLDRSRNLIAALGSFWSKLYDGVDQVHSYTLATAQLVNQSYQNLIEAVESMSRYDVPLFHTEFLSPVVLKKSECNTLRTSSVRFDKTTTTFNNDTISFDRAPASRFFSFPLPDNLADVTQLFNRITFPTGALIKNTDFLIDLDRQVIVFAQDPFANTLFTKRVAPDNPGDTELTLWAFCGKFDYDNVFNQFAYAVGVKLRTSQGYKDLTNAIISGLVEGGATAAILDSALAAICGIPVSVGPVETVEFVDTDARGLLIVTDKAVYRFTENAVPRVEVEQVITAGTQLIYGVDIHEFFVGNVYARSDNAQPVICCPPPNDILTNSAWENLTTETDDDLLLDPNMEPCQPVRKNIAALALDSGFLSACFYGDIVFENKVVPLEIDTAHPSGYTYVKFQLGGYPADLERFFDEVHARGIAAATARKAQDPCAAKRRIGTLAHLFDRRANAETEPSAAHLPKTINPLRFLVENVLRNNVFVVRISVSALGLNQLGLYNIRHLRRLLPPQTAMIVIFELTADKDNIIPENAISEAISKFTGAEPLGDAIPVELVQDLGASARLVSGTCQ